MQTVPLAKLVAKVASRQHGVVSRAQLLEIKVTKRQIEGWTASGRLERVLPGVFRLAGVPKSNEQELSAAVLWAGGNALVSHRSAGALWGFDGMNPAKPEITVPNSMSKRLPNVVVHRTRTAITQRRTRNGLPTTTPERTIIDLAGVLREEQLEIALESARRDRLVTNTSVARTLTRLGPRGRDGAALLQAILHALADQPPCESALEVLVARLLRASDLPSPQRQVEVSAFGEKFRLDFAWPDSGVALECDGKKWHDGKFEHDRARWSAISAATGYRIVWATWRRMKSDPERVLADLRTYAAGEPPRVRPLRREAARPSGI